MNADQQILTQLAKEYREVAFAPVNEERRALWKALNGLRECRCCFSKRMRKVFRKNEKSMLQNYNKKAKRKGRLQRVKKPM